MSNKADRSKYKEVDSRAMERLIELGMGLYEADLNEPQKDFEQIIRPNTKLLEKENSKTDDSKETKGSDDKAPVKDDDDELSI